jgi:hypothetical protein|tara:strand:+ start:1403 stop:1564 length:162 start_codon:yes stop_codon:yes gene_type:complete
MRDEEMVVCIKEVMAVLANHYPDEFQDDGMSMKGVQVIGMLMQLLGSPPMPQQ